MLEVKVIDQWYVRGQMIDQWYVRGQMIDQWCVRGQMIDQWIVRGKSDRSMLSERSINYWIHKNSMHTSSLNGTIKIISDHI